MGARLQHFAHRWSKYTTDPWVLSVVRCGYGLQFNPEMGHPPLTNQPVEMSDRRPESVLLLKQAVTDLLQKEAIEIVENPDTPGFYSRLFLVPKRDGGFRPIIDLKPLNAFLTKEKFKMETQASISAALQVNDWTTSVDLKDAYFHIPIASSSRKYLRFVIDGKTYQFRALPFGLSPAPRVFTRIMSVIADYAHRRGVALHIYLDDWLIRSSSQTQLRQDTALILMICFDLGLIVNYPKSSLEPTREFEFLGIQFSTTKYQCRPSTDRFRRLYNLLKLFLKSRQRSASNWLSLLGSLKSMGTQVPLGIVQRRQLQLSFRNKWTSIKFPLHHPVTISKADKFYMKWWLQQSNIYKGQTLRPFQTQIVICTDASKTGWGAHMDLLTVSGNWPQRYQGCSINWLEMEAIRLALRRWLPLIKNKDILVRSDNRTTVYYINKQGGTKSPKLCYLACRIMLWCQKYGVRLACQHIAGILNVKADILSRKNKVFNTEWSLHPNVIQALWSRWGCPLVDLFATSENFKLPVYVSPYPDPQAWATDALSISWAGLWAYAYPPTPLIPKVLLKVRQEPVELILIAPWWPKRAWTVDALALSLEPPKALPLWNTLLVQPRTSRFHQTPEMLNLHAWRLSRTALQLPDSQRRWQRESPEANFEPLL